MSHTSCFYLFRKFGTATLSRCLSTKPQGEPRKWESVVGLEVHVQIASDTKLFSSSPYSFGWAPNSQVSAFDASTPGTLPVLNKRCVEAAVLTALALNSTIHRVSCFDRKHYFYADMPAGYQITQQRRPLATGGYLNFPVFIPGSQETYYRRAPLKQLQLEQDSGKSLHDSGRGLIDLNRAGVGLMELVFDPCLRDGEEAASLTKELLLLLRAIGACTGKMEEGALRVDANVSVNRPGEPLGVRTEVKNLNSVRAVASAVEYEIGRQVQELSQGRPIQNWTMAFDSDTRRTIPMRDKEVVQDYRFMPEPNLPPLVLDGEEVRKLPTLPSEHRQRLVDEYCLPLHQAQTIVSEDSLLLFFEEVMKQGQQDARRVAHWLLSELVGRTPEGILDCYVDSARFGQLLTLLGRGTISHGTAQNVLQLMVEGDPRTPAVIVDHMSWQQIEEQEQLKGLCLRAMEQHPDSVKKARAGKKRALNPLMAAVRVLSENRADMAAAKAIMLKLIEET
ncbi:glutamyl-tRNA(Gln) amidotransferase subunit B, mitochondrial-like [Ornithodoros turicata]|uniref:glutamyl-tRNA(Gln) amidotransferase subunit B, mitochondrial-like n=1 Tax=Ornithodoros turicata TaxID=34597 RepID=UPI003139036E